MLRLVSHAYSCIQVTRASLAGPDFVWLLPGWFRANWWAAADGTDCTAEEMSKALEHSLGGRGNSLFDNELSRILVSDKVQKIKLLLLYVSLISYRI